MAEAVPRAGRDQQLLHEDGRRPAGPPGEQFLEDRGGHLAPPGGTGVRAGSRLPRPAAEPGGEPPQLAGVRAARPGEAFGGAQTEQIQLGAEDLVPAGSAGRRYGQGRADPGEQGEGQRMGGGVGGDGVVRDTEPGAQPPGLVRGEVTEGYADGCRPRPPVPGGAAVRNPWAARSAYSGPHARTSRTPYRSSHAAVRAVHAMVQSWRRPGEPWARPWPMSSGASRTTTSGRPPTRATWASRAAAVRHASGPAAGNGAGDGEGGDTAVPRGARRCRTRPTASASPVSVPGMSPPRSHTVGAGVRPRARRAVYAMSSVVRPLPGGPVRRHTAAGPSPKAVSRRAGSSRVMWCAGRDGDRSWAAVRARTPARLRSAP